MTFPAGDFTMTDGTFHQKVLECVDKGMAPVGESARQAIYWHIANSQHLKREEIPRKSGQFIKALEAMLGTGAKTIEKGIVMELRREFDLSHDAENFEHALKEAEAKSIQK